MLKKITVITITLLLSTSCTLFKKPQPEPEPVVEPAMTRVDDADSSVTETSEPVTIESNELGSEPVEEVATPIADSGPQSSIDPELDLDDILSDSVWVDYMIKPGDYLSLIAYNEYGNANEWRRIYEWNKEEIGSDPDKIYPYNELDLKKSRAKGIEFEYEFTTYTVQSGESLWSIARKVYKDEYAWVVLFWDNEKMLNEKGGDLQVGMVLKIRTALWPDYEE